MLLAIVLTLIVQPSRGYVYSGHSHHRSISAQSSFTTIIRGPFQHRRTSSFSQLYVSTLPEVEDPPISILEDEDEDLPEGVVCARGVCVIADEDLADELCYLDEDGGGMTCVENTAEVDRNVFSWEFLWPRALLLGCSCLYGTNFPLGRIMNEALPASATTSGRMLLAALALSPFLVKLKPELRKTALLGGSFTALGYLSQSVALVDTPAATVAFLGALTVVITPTTSVLIDKAKMGVKDAPQTWLAAVLCLVGVGVLELGGGSGSEEVVNSSLIDVFPWGDFWSAMQAVGFGVSFFFTERMMAKEPDQALPITGVQVGMTAFFAAIWATLDGTGMLGTFGGDNGAWLLDETTRNQFAIPGLFLSGFGGDETLRTVAIAAGWTALITTAGNRVCETAALGKMSSSEAAVLLATEPLWAALFASAFVGEELGTNDIVGGAFIVAACLATAIKAQTLLSFFGVGNNQEAELEESIDVEVDID